MKRAKLLGRLALAGVVAFIAVCGAAQLWRTDLDWVQAPLSFYLVGPGGDAVKAAYYALSLALFALGWGWRDALEPAARSALAPLLFGVSGIALAVTAASELPFGADRDGVYAFVHGVAAMTTFLCVTVAMLWQSWQLRRDRIRRGAWRGAFALAFAAFAALWIYALCRGLLRGLSQKAVIALILAWLLWAASALQRTR